MQDYVEGTGGFEVISILIGYFSKRVPEQIDQCIGLIQTGDIAGICACLHAMKNSFLNVGAMKAAGFVQELENKVRQKAIGADELLENLSEIREAHKVIYESLQKYYSKLSG